MHYTVTRKELEDAAATVFDAILTGKFKVDIFKKFSLAEVQKAHEELEARLLKGPAVNTSLIHPKKNNNHHQ